MARVTQYQIPAVTPNPRIMLNYSRLLWPTHVLWARVLPPGQPPLAPLHKFSWSSAAGPELGEEMEY